MVGFVEVSLERGEAHGEGVGGLGFGHTMFYCGYYPSSQVFRVAIHATMLSSVHSRRNVLSYYKNPGVDELLLRARRTVDEDDRRELYYRVREIVHEDVSVLPLAYVEPLVDLQE
jgi:ABC-type transport system substrate-binding protein